MASLHLELSYLYARLFRKRLVVTGHYSAADLNRLYTKRKNGKKPLRLQYWETRMKKIMDYATLIAITEEEADAYRTLFGFQNIAVIPNGIRLAEFTPKEHKENFIIFIGRIVPEKRLEFLLEAHKKLEHPLPLIVAGYAPDSAYLDKLKSLAGSGVSFINPPRQQLVELLGKAKALVLPSKNEAFGIVLLEAMASNALVLASNSGGFPTVVGDAGLLFNPDDPADLADKISLLKDDQLCQSLREKGLARVQNYDWDLLVEKVLEVYSHPKS
ncbi:MAG: glycosyltransferase family 4 protein, partial [Bacillota bacterium]|nr:glycosyltransferase family 4 protein [Bacillota bacterium]